MFIVYETALMEEWEAIPFSTLNFIVSYGGLINMSVKLLGTIKGRCLNLDYFIVRGKTKQFL